MSAAINSYQLRAAERRATVAELTRAGRTSIDIAETLGISRRHVERIRQQMGVARPAPKLFTEDEANRAEQLLDDGCSYGEVARTLGRSTRCITHHFPGRGWPVGGFGEFSRLHAAVNRIQVAS